MEKFHEDIEELKKDMEKFLLELELFKLSEIETIPKSEYNENLETDLKQSINEFETLRNMLNNVKTKEEYINFHEILKNKLKNIKEIVNHVRNRTSSN